MKTCKHFIIQELVPAPVFHERGERSFELLDTRLLENLDALREQLDTPLTVNDWHRDGKRTQSGLRQYGSNYYSNYSQHTFGRAADIICGIDAEEIRRRIREGEIILPHPACFELGVSWVHMDVRNSDEHVRFFNP